MKIDRLYRSNAVKPARAAAVLTGITFVTFIAFFTGVAFIALVSLIPFVAFFAVFSVSSGGFYAGVRRTDPPVAVFADKRRAAVFAVAPVLTIGTVFAIGALFPRGAFQFGIVTRSCHSLSPVYFHWMAVPLLRTSGSWAVWLTA